MPAPAQRDQAPMPSDRGQPPAFITLLDEHIETFEELEVVIALIRRAGRSATATQLAADARLPGQDVSVAVDRLKGSGLIELAPPDRLTLALSNPRYAIGLQQLEVEYATNRTRIMSLMTANALRRVRTSAIRTFARAFLLGTKDDG
jgi:hypothetical protein